MKRKTLYVVLGIVAIAAAAGVIFWRSRPTPQPEESSRTAVVERGPMLVAISASGRIEPEEQASLAFETPGRVAEVPVQVGDRIEAGDVLARLDTAQLELEVARSEAALAMAEAQLIQLQEGARSAEIERAEANLRAAEAQLSAAAANRDQVKDGPSEAQIEGAEARVASAQTRKEIAQDTYDLIDKGGERKEQANYDLYTAKQELASAQAELEDLLDGPSDDELRAAQSNVWATASQRDAAQAQLDLLLAGSRKEDIDDAEAKVAQAQAALALTELSLENATLRAPFSGVVSEVNAKAGELAPTGRPAVVVLDDSRFYITVSVDELDVGRLSKGQIAEVTIEALPDAEITGTVEQIAPIATLTGGVVTYDVTIELAPSDAPIRADMTANATISVEELTDVLKIPTWVVRVDQDTGQPFVHQEIGDEVKRVEIELGVRHEGIVQVLDGLSEGDEVIWIESEPTFGPERQ